MTDTIPEYSGQQVEALEAMNSFITGNRLFSKVFYLSGYAGTGKTTLAKSLYNGSFEEDIPVFDNSDKKVPVTIHRVQYGAFTGKAASVMRSKGCTGADTLHGLIYRTNEDPVTGKLTFTYNDLSVLKYVDLIVVDEVSMVNHELGRDLMSFNKPVIVIGDPAQLPPVSGEAYFTTEEPDFMLTEIHRQARDNPIIHASMLVRTGQKIEPNGDALRIIKGHKLSNEEMLAADQILVGRNVTRTAVNKHVRDLMGRKDIIVPGDKLVCLRNNRTLGCYNGTTWEVIDGRMYFDMDNRNQVKMWSMELRSLDDGKEIDVQVPENFFHGTEKNLSPYFLGQHQQFTYGYALTVHKAQGSQWDNVILFDESYCFRADSVKWLYTGLTRAAKKITVVK